MTSPSGERARARSRPLPGRTRRARHRGQALVELALVVPVILILLLGTIDLGRIFYSKIAVTDAAKEGALVASQGGSTSEVTTAVLTEAKGGFVEITAANVAATTCPDNPNGATPPVSVTAASPFHALTPLVAAVLGGSDVMIGSTATARCRYTPPFTATPGPTPTPTATPGPTPTPTPTVCEVPNFKNSSTSASQSTWAAAGFTTVVTITTPPALPYTIKTQSLTKNSSQPCTSNITVGP
jgi:Flp pilus assembly protein TadG